MGKNTQKNKPPVLRQEKEVLGLLIKGYTDMEIADELNMSLGEVYRISCQEDVKYVAERLGYAKCMKNILVADEEMGKSPSIASSMNYIRAVSIGLCAGHLGSSNGKAVIDGAAKIMQAQQSLLLEVRLASFGSIGKRVKSLDSPDESDLKKSAGRMPNDFLQPKNGEQTS